MIRIALLQHGVAHCPRRYAHPRKHCLGVRNNTALLTRQLLLMAVDLTA